MASMYPGAAAEGGDTIPAAKTEKIVVEKCSAIPTSP